MTSRNEVRIDIEVEGGAKAERQFARAEKGARGLGRTSRGLINPLIGAGLVAGILGGGLLSLALSSGSASNSIFRIQGALEGLTSVPCSAALSRPSTFVASQFEKLPVAAQLAVLAAAAVLGVIFVKLIGAAAGAISGAVTSLVSSAIGAPLVTAATSAVQTAAAAIATATGAAVAAVIVGLAAIALLVWDEIFNDGALLRRFEAWLGGMAWVAGGPQLEPAALNRRSRSLGQRSSDASKTTLVDPIHASFPRQLRSPGHRQRMGELPGVL